MRRREKGNEEEGRKDERGGKKEGRRKKAEAPSLAHTDHMDMS